MTAADEILRDRIRAAFPGETWLAVMLLAKDFTPCPCHVESCTNRAAERILVNVCATVFEYDTCAACSKVYAGKLLDGFPARPYIPRDRRDALTADSRWRSTTLASFVTMRAYQLAGKVKE